MLRTWFVFISFSLFIFGCSAKKEIAGFLGEPTPTTAPTTEPTPVNLGNFAITGVSGGTDVTKDAWLNGNSANPSISWTASSNASSYDITVYEYDGSTTKCSLVNVSTLSNDFTSCSLTDQTSYKIKVIAKTSGDSIKQADNNFYIFTYYTLPAGNNSVFSPATVPGNIEDSTDLNSVELGMKFQSDIDGYILGVRFYKGINNTGVHSGTLWNSSTGTSLATVNFSGETSSGWQQQLFASPVAILANTTYVISYHAPVGLYSYDHNGFAADIANSPLRGLADGFDGNNGLFFYDPSSVFPTNTHLKSNYYVDVVFGLPFNTAPLPFSITGITGGTDVVLDDQLQDVVAGPILNWADTVGETSYDVSIFADDGTSLICATVNVTADATQHNFASCSLPRNTYYKAKVLAIDAAGATKMATNGLYRFFAQP
ncbi:MAG: DUF4082 domain-containing protein [Bdellovibrionales bacterium]|nr:DUF4082 domain-containing protein [Bdellovibrionales bacterium]